MRFINYTIPRLCSTYAVATLVSNSVTYKNIEILRMTGEVNPQTLKQTNKYFLRYKQLNTFDHPYYIHKCLDSEPSTFLLVNRYIIFDKFDKHIQLHMIMIYISALLAKGPSPDINNGPVGDLNSTHILAPAFIQIQRE